MLSRNRAGAWLPKRVRPRPYSQVALIVWWYINTTIEEQIRQLCVCRTHKTLHRKSVQELAGKAQEKPSTYRVL